LQGILENLKHKKAPGILFMPGDSGSGKIAEYMDQVMT
jgi:hypothetical protein